MVERGPQCVIFCRDEYCFRNSTTLSVGTSVQTYIGHNEFIKQLHSCCGARTARASYETKQEAIGSLKATQKRDEQERDAQGPTSSHTNTASVVFLTYIRDDLFIRCSNSVYCYPTYTTIMTGLFVSDLQGLLQFYMIYGCP